MQQTTELSRTYSPSTRNTRSTDYNLCRRDPNMPLFHSSFCLMAYQKGEAMVKPPDNETRC